MGSRNSLVRETMLIEKLDLYLKLIQKEEAFRERTGLPSLKQMEKALVIKEFENLSNHEPLYKVVVAVEFPWSVSKTTNGVKISFDEFPAALQESMFSMKNMLGKNGLFCGADSLGKALL
jgi:hypothetical protein